MRLTHTLVNDVTDELEVWVEPWADLYVVDRGAKVAFTYSPQGVTALLESEVTGARVTFWFNGIDAPHVTIDGDEVGPVDQYERRRQLRDRG